MSLSLGHAVAANLTVRVRDGRSTRETLPAVVGLDSKTNLGARGGKITATYLRLPTVVEPLVTANPPTACRTVPAGTARTYPSEDEV